MIRSPCSRIFQRSLTIEWKHAKYLGEILELFKEKKHQVMWSLYLPSTSGVKTYSHRKAERASFTVLEKCKSKSASYSRREPGRTSSRENSQGDGSDGVAQGGATKQHCQAKCTYNQIGQRATIACVKFCGLDKSRLLKIGNTLNLRSLCVCLIKSLLFHKVWM